MKELRLVVTAKRSSPDSDVTGYVITVTRTLRFPTGTNFVHVSRVIVSVLGFRIRFLRTDGDFLKLLANKCRYFENRLTLIGMTLNDVEGHSPIASFLSNVFRTVVQSLTRTQLTQSARVAHRH